MTNLTMNVRTASAIAVTGSQFSVNSAGLDIVSGLVYSNIFTYPDAPDLEDNFYPRPDQGGPDGGGGARHLILSDTDTLSSISVTPTVGGWNLVLTLRANFSKEGIDPGFDLLGSTDMVATGFISARIPEPGTLAMILGLVASLAVYGWKRRAAR
jgi:hypothetical protein